MIAKWFRGKEMATAMGVQVALARVGSQAAYAVAIPVARSFELTTPVLIGLVCLVGGMIAFFSFSVLDKKLDTRCYNPFKSRILAYRPALRIVLLMRIPVPEVCF